MRGSSLASESGYSGVSAEEVDWDCEVFYCWVTEEDAEDVECVMAVICEGERVDEGVVVRYCCHDGHSWESHDCSREMRMYEFSTQRLGE